jgi:hypothetical protein
MAIKYIPSSDITRAILALYDATDATTRENGELWYQNAREECELLATEFDISIPAACGIVAALSPNLRWERNIRAARAILEGNNSEAYPANEYKARRILQGELPLDVLGGLKVRAFYSNILNGGMDSVVTIDGHAFNAAYGLVQPVKKANVTVVQNRTLQRAYIVAARMRGITGPVMQAIVWIKWRDIVLGDTQYADRVTV